MKKTKPYTGEVPFNYFGEFVTKPWGYSIAQFTADDFASGRLFLSRYDPVSKTNRREFGFFDPSLTKIEFLATPPPNRPHIVAEGPSHVWLPNYTFTDSMEYVGYNQGRSSVNITLRSLTDKREYTCFMKVFEKFIKVMEKGVIHNQEFTFTKRGESYSLTLAEK